MKWINIILSMYLVMLSCLPCADTLANNTSSATIEIVSQDKMHSHEKMNDSCSPFCICNCCTAQILTQVILQKFSFGINIETIDSTVPNYHSTFIANFLGSIWQPPQIV